MKRYGYMDYVDFCHELGEAKGGNRVFASVKDLKENQNCVEECGIVKVSVEQVEVVQPSNYSLEGDEYSVETHIKHLLEELVRLEEAQVRIKNYIKSLESE